MEGLSPGALECLLVRREGESIGKENGKKQPVRLEENQKRVVFTKRREESMPKTADRLCKTNT